MKSRRILIHTGTIANVTEIEYIILPERKDSKIKRPHIQLPNYYRMEYADAESYIGMYIDDYTYMWLRRYDSIFILQKDGEEISLTL